MPLQIQQQVKNNLGGHWNHTLLLGADDAGRRQGSRAASSSPRSKLVYRTSTKFKEQLNEAGGARFGSGWAWLIVNKNKKLEITSTANQDTPIEAGAGRSSASMSGSTPII